MSRFHLRIDVELIQMCFIEKIYYAFSLLLIYKCFYSRSPNRHYMRDVSITYYIFFLESEIFLRAIIRRFGVDVLVLPI